VDGREGERSANEKKKKKKTNQRTPRVRQRRKGAARAREKWGTTPPHVCQREGGPMYLLREEKRSAGTRKEKRKTHMRRCWGAEVGGTAWCEYSTVTWQMWHCFGKFPRLTL
jgi:hypothetical protein